MELNLNLTRNWGLSLIELLIAMALGLTLSAVVVQVYVSATVTERSQDARLRLQENGRFALNFLSQEIRMGGYLGCLGALRGPNVNNTLNAPPNSFQPQFGVQGWEAGGTNPGTVNNSVNDVAVVATNTAEWTSDPGGVNIIPVVNAVPNSDIIRIWSATGSAGGVAAITQGTPPTITAESAVGIQVNDFLIISDCQQADFVQACAVVANPPPA
ncbi:MAG: pilus assembly protein PilW, partial [Gammaproteobacteria bacterium]|nr:pilus assembly protein PilW [Gammaproteobacteria bacterium]